MLVALSLGKLILFPRNDFHRDNCFGGTTPDPTLQGGLKSTRRIGPHQREGDGFEERRFPRRIVPRDDGPAGVAVIRPLEVKVEMLEATEVVEHDALDVHGAS